MFFMLNTMLILGFSCFEEDVSSSEVSPITSSTPQKTDAPKKTQTKKKAPSKKWTEHSIQEERKEIRRLMRPGTRTIVYEPPQDIQPPPNKGICTDCDIILVTMCSLRKDYIGAYKIRPSVTPNIDAIAQKGVIFDQSYSASNFTLGGLAAILTGRYGISSGVTDFEKGLPKDIYTLPQVLSFYGFHTAAFTIEAASGFRPEHGLDRGFLRMELTSAPRNTPDGRWLGSAETVREEGDGASAKPVERWMMRQSPDKPLFVMFHTRTAHYPFLISTRGAREDKTGVTQALWDVGRTTSNISSDARARTGFGKGDETSGGDIDPLQTRIQDKGAPAIAMLHKHYRDSVARMDKDIAVLIETQKKRAMETMSNLQMPASLSTRVPS